MSVKHSDVKSAVACIAAQIFLWMYIQKGMFTVVFESVQGLGELFSACAVLSGVMLSSATLAFFEGRGAEKVLQRRSVLVAGIVGSVACAGAVALATVEPASSAAHAIVFALLFLQGTAFSVVFLAWCDRLVGRIYSDGLGTVLLWVLIAIAVSLLLIPNWLNGSSFQRVLDLAGLSVASALIYLFEGDRVERAKAEKIPRGVRSHTNFWVALIAVFLFIGGYLGHSSYLMEGYASTNEGTTAYLLMFIVILAMMVLVQYVDLRGGVQGISAIMLVFGLVALSFFALFAILFILINDAAFCWDLARFTRRMTRVTAFVALLIMVYQLDLLPVRTIGLAFVIPTFLPKLVQMLTARLFPGVGQAFVANGTFVASLLVVGFVLALCLIGICFLSINGDMARALLQDQMGKCDDGPAGLGSGSEVERADVPTRVIDRREASGILAVRYGLTRRETDILQLISMGYSIRKIAEELVVSEGTVNTHSAALYKKLGIHSRQEAIDMVGRVMRDG